MRYSAASDNVQIFDPIKKRWSEWMLKEKADQILKRRHRQRQRILWQACLVLPFAKPGEIVRLTNAVQAKKIKL